MKPEDIGGRGGNGQVQRTTSEMEAGSGDTFPARKTSSGNGGGLVVASSGGRLAMRRNVSRGNLIADRAESKVLVIYAGGTIGMIRNETGGKSAAN